MCRKMGSVYGREVVSQGCKATVSALFALDFCQGEIRSFNSEVVRFYGRRVFGRVHVHVRERQQGDSGPIFCCPNLGDGAHQGELAFAARIVFSATRLDSACAVHFAPVTRMRSSWGLEFRALRPHYLNFCICF